MAKIAIKDLPESVDLDREAMLAITGGARIRGRQAFPGPSIVRSKRIVSFPGGFATSRPTEGKGRKPAK